MSPKFKIIVCCDRNFGIGYQNNIPWTNTDDLKLFRDKTIGHGNNCVIMGSRTYKSIPDKFCPLPFRHNYVLSSSSSESLFKKKSQQHSLLHHKRDIINLLQNEQYEEYWVIGGQSVYELFLTKLVDYVSEIHISILEESYSCDTFFIDPDKIGRFCCVQTEIYNSFVHKVYVNREQPHASSNTAAL
jgi:dihydrofolate reductase